MAPYDNPNKKEIQESGISRKNHGYSLLELKKCNYCVILAQGDNNECKLQYWNIKNSECSPLNSTQKKNIWCIAPQWQC